MIKWFLFFSLSFVALNALTLDEKIGQLFIAPVYPRDENALTEDQFVPNREYVETLIAKYHIGGIILKFYWEFEEEKKTIEHYQSLSKIPLFVCQDVEWGLAQRVTDIEPVSKADGKEIGRQCRQIGVNFALAPVADVNTNPNNPVIGDRSFGSDPDQVAETVVKVVNDIQSFGVIATAKHFPGHGDTETDSHHTLPILKHDRTRLDEVELKPFRAAIDHGVKAVMTGHLSVLAFDEPPASLSSKVIKGLLREELNFNGLIITDDLLMKAVRSDNAALEAFKAGNDLILSAPDIPRAFHQIKQAILAGDISEAELDERIARIMRLKRDLIGNSKTRCSLRVLANK